MRRDNRYNQIIQEKLEPNFNRIIPIAASVAWLSALFIYFSSIPKWFAWFDVVIGLVFIIMTILKDQIHIEIKILITISVPTIIGILAFLDGGFDSAGVTLILVSNVIAVMLLPKKESVVTSITSIVIFIGLFIIAKIYQVEKFIYIRDAEWMIQFAVFSFFLLLLQIVTYSIRKHLVINIEELEKSGEQTYKLAFYDQLTGLPNQNLFKKYLAEKNNQSINGGFLIIYNIKNVNIINSIYGDEIGNQVLIEAVNVFERNIKEKDILARNSGNEFAIWLENISEGQLMEWFEQIDYIFKREFYVPNMTKKLEFYISYTSYKSGQMKIDECYQKACTALIYAKRNNQSEIIAYNKTFEENLRNEENFKELLLEAIAAKSFNVYYQPKVEALTGEVIGVEALARWYSDSLGFVGPDVFIPFIEKINQSIAFGELIIKKVFSDYNEICNKYNKDIKVAINVSPTHLMSSGFVQYFSKMVQEYNIKTDKIILEVTEEIMIQGDENVSEVLNAIRRMGIEISLDDFGSGYSSYNYLMKLDIDELKIDKSFVDRLCECDKTSILLKSIIYIAQNYNLTLIAEGVETKEQRDKLVLLGCHIMQGYYFSKPEPLNAE